MRARLLLRGACWLACGGVFGSVAVLGCGDKDSRPPPAANGGGTPFGGAGGGAGDGGRVDGGGDGSLDGGTCTNLDFTGGLVDRLAIVGEPPPGNGGQISEGTYDLTDLVVYVTSGTAGPTGVQVQSSLLITTDAVQRVDRIVDSAGTAVVGTSGSGFASGAIFNYSQSCPKVAGESFGLTASPTVLVLTNIATRESFTYKKR